MRTPYDTKTPDERFIGNVVLADWPKFKAENYPNLTTFRVGKFGYDIHGKQLPDTIRSLFIHKSEYDAYNALCEAQLKRIINGQ